MPAQDPNNVPLASSKIDLLLASPLRRTIETALVAFYPVIQRGLRILAIPEAQEATDEQSDTGSDIAVLETWFDDQVDFRFLTPGWNEKIGANSIDVASTKARATKLRQWIKAREEKQVVLVSHGRFAHYLTGDVDDEGNQTTGWWVNDEFRTFVFVDDEKSDGEAMIRETEESKTRREEIKQEKQESGEQK